MRVVVIGSGVTGAAAAYELARSGAQTVLVDADFAGRATAAGAGIICPWSSRETDPDWHRIATAGAEFYPALLAALEEDAEAAGPGPAPGSGPGGFTVPGLAHGQSAGHGPGHGPGIGAVAGVGPRSAGPEGVAGTGYRRVGALRLLEEHEADAVFAQTAERAARSPQAGSVSLCDGARARALFPPLRHEGPVLHLTGAARVDGRLLDAALRRGAAGHGARTVTGDATIATRGDRATGVRVNGELIPADAVVAAAGAWSPQLLGPLGVPVPVAPQRGQIVHLRLPGTDTSDWPVVFPRSRHYLLTFDDSRVVVGATREDGSGFDHRVTAAGVAEVLHEALAVAPGLAGATHVETRVGFRPVGPDALPLLGRVPQYEGLIVANGLGASGLTIGPYAGTLAARLALGRDPGMDLTPYDPLRASTPAAPSRSNEHPAAHDM
ncbi:FAD-binding oxidoreductase [Streptomyces sp. ODS28]|uniref:NAD(P)/FAD-dependent oxidoreductase n=1 Tax=Streptomyces sp. ODS28 TaxID=3136688 RepID=UPI0031E90292